jgi:hypothetical protein
LTNGRGHPFLQTDDGSDGESVDNDNQNGNNVNYESEGVSFSFVAVQRSIASDFASTFRSAGDLSASEVAGSWDVLVTVLVLGGFFTFMFILAARADADDYKKSILKNSLFGTATVTAANSLNRSKGFGRSGKGAFGSRPPPVYSASSLHIREVQKDFNKIEASLPAVLRSEAVWTVYVKEIKVCINVF